MSTLDPLRLPLQGRQLIEASAGTGKTWALAALYLRLVLGHGRSDPKGLQPSHILVMTFTDAATAELRDKFAQQGVEVEPSTPEQFSTLLQTELGRWAKIIKAAKIQGE